MLPHAAHLAGSPYAWLFTWGLGLSLLQRKPDEWRHQHATPSSGGRANVATASPDKTKNTRVKATAVAVNPDNNEHLREDHEESEARTSPSEKRRGRKKRKRSGAAGDEIDALFDDAIGRMFMRNVLEAAAAPVKAEKTNVELVLKPGRGQSVNHRLVELGAVIDKIKVAPRSGGKKRSK